MASMTEMKPAFDEGREAQFREMMQQLAQLQAKYKGVRGELLSKVRDELSKLKPSAAIARAPAAVAALSPEKILPSCRVCGRGMRVNGSEGTLICQNGHTRLAT